MFLQISCSARAMATHRGIESLALDTLDWEPVEKGFSVLLIRTNSSRRLPISILMRYHWLTFREFTKSEPRQMVYRVFRESSLFYNERAHWNFTLLYRRNERNLTFFMIISYPVHWEILVGGAVKSLLQRWPNRSCFQEAPGQNSFMTWSKNILILFLI